MGKRAAVGSDRGSTWHDGQGAESGDFGFVQAAAKQATGSSGMARGGRIFDAGQGVGERGVGSSGDGHTGPRQFWNDDDVGAFCDSQAV